MADGFRWDDAVSVGISILAGIVFVIALMAYRRRPTARVLLFCAAFGVLFLKGLFALSELVVGEDRPLIQALELLADAAVVLLFFLGMMKD